MNYAKEKVTSLNLKDVKLKFDANGLIPVVVQQMGSGEVLMVAWANQEAVMRTVDSGTSWFWSRSRQELWNKGATSGNTQVIHSVLLDCDADTLLYLVDSPGPACHTGHRSCFYQSIEAGRMHF